MVLRERAVEAVEEVAMEVAEREGVVKAVAMVAVAVTVKVEGLAEAEDSVAVDTVAVAEQIRHPSLESACRNRTSGPLRFPHRLHSVGLRIPC